MIPDIDEKSVGKVEKLINAVWGLLVRNWGKLLVMGFLTGLGYFIYLVVEDIENEDQYYQEEIEEYPEEDYQYEGKH